MVQIHMLWGLRKSEPDTPELMVAWDEYSIDANGDGYQLAKEKEISAWGNELVRCSEILIDLPYDAIMKSLVPATPKFAVSWLNETEMRG